MLVRKNFSGDYLLQIRGMDYRFSPEGIYKGSVAYGGFGVGLPVAKGIVIYSVIVHKSDNGASVSRFVSCGVDDLSKSTKFYHKTELKEKVMKKLNTHDNLLFKSKIEIGADTVQYLYVLKG